MTMIQSVDMNMKTSYTRNKMPPQKFALYVSLASIIMMFIGLTSAFIVRKAAGNWLEFYMPQEFYISAGVILLSSLTMHAAVRSFKKSRQTAYRGSLIATFVLGVIFIVLQYQGWIRLTEGGIALNGNPSGSFVYAISALHAAHILGGLAVLLVCILGAFTKVMRPTQKRLMLIEISAIYWHFVDFLWLYLLVFMIWQM